MKKSKSQKFIAEKESSQKPIPEDFLVAGIGASAGGIQALKEFFENVPADSGVAYVVILHLSPDHESRLAEVLQTTAQIPVTQVKERVKVEPNHVYVVPPNQHLEMLDGHIGIEENASVEARRAPVDIFFRTLAEARHAGAIAIILSGTSADGSMGLKRVKERGGVVFVQNPREAEFSEMPRNSIATELVDHVLNVREIPAKIVAYKNNFGAFEIQDNPESRPENDQAALREIFANLRVRTGHDFTNYKHPTVLRRIERRINVRELQTLAEYAVYMRDNPDEVIALLKDLLISVTNFFRDKEAFEFLETEVVPRILQDKSSQNEIRVWVAGCATGEEAYSLAMLFIEQTEGSPVAPSIQIFATDIDEDAITHSREGFYTLVDAADVLPERLRRFFTKDSGGYRVRRELREMILFAKHNILKDPPFSHLDLVTCRNLLIYFNHTAQERTMETFHFALNPGAFLFLGTSESVDGAGDLYAPVNKEFRIYQSRQAAARIAYPVPGVPNAVRYNEPQMLPKSFTAGASPEQDNRQIERISFGDLHQQLLEQYAPPSIVVNENYDIVHLSERAGRFLHVAGGEPSKNLLRLVRPELRLELRTALFQAVQRRANVVAANLKVQTNGHQETINIQVRPVLGGEDTARGFLLVLFEPSHDTDGDTTEKIIASDEPLARRLEAELERTKARLTTSVEQYEAQTEELRASNDELQAMNEELRLTAEELETSREELQSVNEELMTVNDELKISVVELSKSNDDFKNLLNSTDIGTIFLDRRLRVKLFTPPAREVFNLIEADLNRPLADITTKMDYADLQTDVETVLDTLHTVEREFENGKGKWYLMRVFPYRTKEDKISGAVVTFIEITKRIESEQALRKIAQSREQQTRVFDTALSSIADFAYTFDSEGRFTYANKPLLDLLGITIEEITGKTFHELPYPSELADKLHRQIGQAIKTRKTVTDETPFVNPAGEDGFYEYIFAPVIGEDGAVEVVAGSTRVITERRRAEQKPRESEARFRAMFEQANVGIVQLTTDGHLLAANPGFCKIIGYDESEARRLTVRDITHADDYEREMELNRQLVAGEIPGFSIEKRYVCKDGNTVWANMTGTLVRQTKSDEPLYTLSIVEDISERKAAEEAVRESETQMRLVVEAAEMGTWDWNLQTGAVRWNDQHFRLFGLEPENRILSYVDFEQGVHPDYREAVRERLEQAIAHDKVFQTEFLCLHPDRSTRWMSGYGRVIEHDAAGRATRMTGVMFDATERKATEEAVRESEERLRLLVESASDHAIFTMTLDNKINTWNAGAEKVFGWTESEALGQTGAIIFTPEDRAKGEPEHEIETALKEGRAPDERFHLRKDGTRFYVSGVMTLLRDSDEKVQGFAKIARDMTDKIAAESSVREKEMLQKLVAAQEDERKRIARDLHDELGQQLTALRLKLESIRKMCEDTELAGKIDETQIIAKSIDNGVDFLAWELRPAALDDLGLFAALEKYIREWSHHSGITAELLASGLKRTRFAPEVETNLYRITQESLNNTHKHANAKRAEVLLEKRGSMIVLIIEDDGQGFDVRRKANRRKGLGLTGMRERATLIGGAMEIESAPGRGTTIHIRVPVEAAKKRGA